MLEEDSFHFSKYWVLLKGQCMALEQRPKKKITLFKISWGNTGGENLFFQPSDPLYTEKKSLIIEKALNQNAMYITGNLLRVFKDRKKVFSR